MNGYCEYHLNGSTQAVHRLGFYAKKYGYRPTYLRMRRWAKTRLPCEFPRMSDADQERSVEVLAQALGS
jgi:hypothetical protein